MSESTQRPLGHREEGEIDLREVFGVLWAGRWVIVVLTTATTILATIVALMLPNVYRAEALLAPAYQQSGGSLSSLSAQYGGLASLAGINLGGGTTDKTALGLEVLKSRKFISEFIDRHDLLVPLMAAEGWDEQSRELLIDPGVYSVATGEWLRNVSPPQQTIPSSQEAYEEFRRQVLTVSHDSQSGLVTVAIEHYSPIRARQWVDWLVADLNSAMMQQDVAEAEQAIEYLNEQIAATSLSDLQGVFFGLVEEQMKTVMLARVSNEYLFRTIDPAIEPEIKSGPRRAAIVVMSAATSILVAILFLLLFGGKGRKKA